MRILLGAFVQGVNFCSVIFKSFCANEIGRKLIVSTVGRPDGFRESSDLVNGSNMDRENAFHALYVITLSIVLLGAHGAPPNARLEHFPGYDWTLPSAHYAGYITVGRNNERHLYYYFATSQRNPSEDPVVLWLDGGPGCAALNVLLHQIGPFKFDTASARVPKVQLNPYSLNKICSIIYVDSPAGTGFSYSDTVDDKTGDIKTVLDAYAFTLKWFDEYPEFLSNPFYVSGCSYGGYFVPTVSQEIVNGIESGIKPTLNFKGYMLGNAITDEDFDLNSKIPFAYRMGLISEELYGELKDACNGNYWNSSDPDCLLKMQAYKQNVAGINPFHILCLPCRYETRTEEVITSQENLLECSDPSEDMEWPSAVTMNGYFRPWPLHLYYDAHCLDYNERPRILLNDPASRKALHAQPEEITGEWLRCTNHLVYQKEFGSMIKYHMNLTKKGYRAFIYSGDHDFALPYLGTQAWIQSMGYSIIEKWWPWFVGDQIAGYSTKYDHNLTFATFKGGGHTVPEYQPQQALVAYARWLNEDPL